MTLFYAAVLSSCLRTPDRPDSDVEDPDGAALVAAARVTIPREPLEAGGLVIRSFVLRVASLRLVSDRGAAFDQVRTDVGTIELADATSLEFPSIPPASYSAAVIVLDGAASVLEIDADDVGGLGPVHLSYGSRLEWMARCSSGVPVGLGEMLEIAVDVELSGAWEELRSAALPAAIGGVVTIDQTTAPAAVEEFVRALGESVRSECDRDGL